MPRPTLTTADGLVLTSRRWLTSAPPRASVVLVHGFSASSVCPQVVALADALHADNLDVVTYDARGHGTSPGHSTLGDDERHDVGAAVTQARERAPAVVLVGASMGAIAVLRYAATDPDLAGVVAISCPAAWRLPRSARGVLGALMTRTPPGRELARRLIGVRIASRWNNPEPPIELVRRIAVPVTFVHGTHDRFIHPRDAALLHDAANDPRRLVIVEDMGHAFGPSAVDPTRAAVAWSLQESAVIPGT
jgi:alpha-beta hydrolase superfamily lysophospholipase